MFDEPGTELAAELWDRAESVVSSHLVYPEARAAAAAAQRGGRITSAVLRRAVARVDELCGELNLVGVDLDLARSAGDLAEAHGLRGYDAVHLATAMRIDVEALLVTTWDGDLARATVAAGLSVSPPPARR